MQTVMCTTCGEQTENYIRFRCINPRCDIPVHYTSMDCAHRGPAVAEQIMREALPQDLGHRNPKMRCRTVASMKVLLEDDDEREVDPRRVIRTFGTDNGNG